MQGTVRLNGKRQMLPAASQPTPCSAPGELCELSASSMQELLPTRITQVLPAFTSGLLVGLLCMFYTFAVLIILSRLSPGVK